jgi:AcrR family transcriptional regulator
MSIAAAEVRSASARSEATRKRVVEAAIACIAEEGFQASNLSRIARYAGMTTGAIQHQFGDKTTLLAEVVERGFEQMVDRLARMPGGEDPLAARVSKLVEALWSGYDAAGTRASLEILFAMRGDAAFHERSIAFLAAMRQRVDRLWMGTFWDAPCGRAGHIEAQRAVFATLNGLALERILVPGMPDPAPDLARLARHALALLEARPAEE